MQKDDVKQYLSRLKLDGEGRHIMTGTLLAMKTKWTKRYCLLLLNELENEGFLQHKLDYVRDIYGEPRINKCYWKR